MFQFSVFLFNFEMLCFILYVYDSVTSVQPNVCSPIKLTSVENFSIIESGVEYNTVLMVRPKYIINLAGY